MRGFAARPGLGRRNRGADGLYLTRRSAPTCSPTPPQQRAAVRFDIAPFFHPDAIHHLADRALGLADKKLDKTGTLRLTVFLRRAACRGGHLSFGESQAAMTADPPMVGAVAPILVTDKARSLVRDLTVADDLLNRIDVALRNRVRVRLATAIARLRSDARRLYEQARSNPPDPIALWAEVHAIRSAVDELLEECLLLVQGSCARAMRVDDGYCAVADALVDELVARTPVDHWSSFTVLGGSERYSRTSRVIQIRFPAPSLWDLPLVAHELGHFIGPALVEDSGLRSEHPLDLVFDRYGDDSEKSWSYLQEFFADAFASHLLGPAYALSCVANAFDPLLALLPSETHPAASQRVEVIAATLRGQEGGALDAAADQMVNIWNQLVQDSEGAAGRDQPDPSPFAAPVVALVIEQLPVAGYDGWDEAGRLADRLTAPQHPSGRNGSHRMADVLNAAWLARLRTSSPSAVDRIAAAGMALLFHLTSEVS